MLPAPYEDELFYSVVARFADRMGLRTPLAAARLVFDLDRITPIIEFPPRLDQLIPRLLPTSPFEPDVLLAEYSLVPYFTAFMPEDRADKARASVLAADAISAFARLGINTIQNSLSLRFCRDCVASDANEGKEPYWRRRHNLPGVSFCTSHCSQLIEGAPVRRNEWSGFVSVARILHEGYETNVSSDTPSDLLLAIATSSAALLNRPEPHLGGNLASRFFERLHDAGWQHGRRIATTKIIKVAKERLGPDVLTHIHVSHPRLNSRTNPRLRGRSTEWLAQCLRVRGSVSHPLPYILLLIALEIDIESLFAGGVDREEPPGELNGPCGNPVCPDADLPVPRPLQSISGDGMYTVRCARCGYSYRQKAQAMRPSDKRMVTFGPLWDEALRLECERGASTKLQIQNALNADIYTIKRRALELGLWHPRWGNETQKATREKKDREWAAQRSVSRDRYRRKWEVMAASHPGAGRREIGRLDEVTYAFLRTYDAAWLDRTTPKKAREIAGAAAPSSGDAALADLISDTAKDIRAVAPPRRITRASIAKALGKADVRLRPEKFPRSVAALVAAMETPSAFGLRQKEWNDANNEVPRINGVGGKK